MVEKNNSREKMTVGLGKRQIHRSKWMDDFISNS